VERVTWRLEISHVTRYTYDRPVTASFNEARLTPVSGPGQLVIEAEVSVRPAAELFCFTDYWGTVVHAFDVHGAHQSLLVASRAVVDTGPAPVPVGDTNGSVSWEELASEQSVDRFYEFLAPSRFVTPHELTQVASQLRCQRTMPAEAVPAAVDWVHSQLEYGSGATHVHSSAIEAWHAGRGVCQDFAHLSLALLRAMGIPARYVSGYFYPEVKGAIGARVVGESHAWVEAWTGTWAGHDPTNRVRVGERHVVVARGRDYADVAPVRGIYSGPSGTVTEVTVELARQA
jgi:transglutaminase-like putative cysteine protease